MTILAIQSFGDFFVCFYIYILGCFPISLKNVIGFLMGIVNLYITFGNTTVS